MSEEQISALIEFGKAVIAGAKPGTVEVPEFELKPAQLKQLAEKCNEKGEEYKIGFANDLFRTLIKSTQNATAEETKEFCAIVLDFAKKETRKETLTGILKATNELFIQVKGDWPELVAFLLNENEKEHEYFRGQFIAISTVIRETDFPKEHLEKLLKAIGTLLVSPIFDELPISSLLMVMTLGSPEFKDIEPYVENIWNASLRMAEKDNYQAVCPSLYELKKIAGFSKFTPDCVGKRIIGFFNAELDVQAKTEIIKPVIRLFPFLDDDSITQFLTNMIAIAKENLEEAMQLMDLFDEAELDLIEDDTTCVISVMILDAFEKGDVNEGLVIFAPFADIVIVDEEFEKKTNLTIKESLDGDENSALCALYALRHTASRLQEGSLDLFKSVIKHIPNDKLLGQFAFDAVEEMFETTLFADEQYIKAIIEAYPTFNSNTSKFAKLVIAFLDKCDDPGISVSIPIYEFAVPLIATDKTEMEKALALRLLTELADIDKEIVEDRVEDMMETGLAIIKSGNMGCVASAANFLATMSTEFQKETRDRVLDQLPYLISIVTKEVECDNNNRNAISTAVCDIVSTFDLRDDASNLSKIAAADLTSESEEAKDEAVEMLFVLCKSLLPDTAIPLFDQLAEVLSTYTSVSTVDTVVKTLKSLMKKYRVDIEVAKNVTRLIFEGKVPAIGQIDSIENPETAVFSYLKTFTKKYKMEALPFIRQVIGVLSFIDDSVLEAAFEPIEVAIRLSKDNEFLDKESVDQLAGTLRSLLAGDDNDNVKYAAPVVSAFRESFPGVLNDQEIIELLNDKLEVCDDQEDGDTIGVILALILSVAKTSKVNEQLITECCTILPISPESCDLVEVFNDAVEISEIPEISENTLLSTLFLISRVVLMKKQQLSDYDVPGDVIQSGRKHITKMIKANPKIKAPLQDLLIKKKLPATQVKVLLK